MKKKYFICLVISFIFTSNITYGQQIYQLVDTTNKWFDYGNTGGYGTVPVQHTRINYFFDGDTIINSVSYKKLMRNLQDTIFSATPFIQSYNYCVAAFRQDNQKVYFVLKGTTTENLYCDFEMTVGDTLKYFYNNNNPKAIITSISSIPFGNGVRKQFILNNGFSFYEGIGNSLGLFHDFGILIEGGSYLSCFMQNNIVQNVYAFQGNQICELCPTIEPEKCKANAGADTALCEFNEIQLGGNSVVTGGHAPYTYKWFIDPIELLGHVYTASDFLNDTTLSNPTLTNNGNDVFTLEVTDAYNQTCKDTVRIYSPSWIITLDQKSREVSSNTPVELYTSVHSESSLLTYLWSPTTGLSNPTIVNTTAITDASITYNLLITDSAGCQVTDIFDIIINDTKITNVPQNEKIDVKEIDGNYIFETDNFDNKYLELYEMTGRKISGLKFKSNQIMMKKADLPSGIYIFKVLDNNVVIKIGKIKTN